MENAPGISKNCEKTYVIIVRQEGKGEENAGKPEFVQKSHTAEFFKEDTD